MCNKFYCEFQKFTNTKDCSGCNNSGGVASIKESEDSRIKRMSSKLMSAGFKKAGVEFILDSRF